MEQKVFPASAVAEVLKQSYVEARLHTDGPPREDENKTLQLDLTGMRSNPVYLFVNPWTKKVAGQQGGAVLDPDDFAELLRKHEAAVTDEETAAAR